MNMLEKNCKYCNKVFKKPYNISRASWFGNKKRPNGTQYCSRYCAGKDVEFSEEHRTNISVGLKKAYKEGKKDGFSKGFIPWNKGMVGIVEAWNKGIPCSDEMKDRISESLSGRYSGEKSVNWKGGKIEKTCLFCNKKYLVFPYRKDESKYCSKECHSADYPHIMPIKLKVRNCDQYKQWRAAIFERDNYTCQLCGQNGGKLNVDHIKAFSLIWIDNNIESFKNALLCDELWDLDNGRTLCDECHKMTDNYGVRTNSEVTVTAA